MWGELLLSMRGNRDMGMAQGLIALGERTVIQRMVFTPLVDCAYTRGVAALAYHKSELKANDTFQPDTLAGKHDTLAGHRPPPKWYR